MLYLEKVNGNNVWDILKLTVSKSQKNFVATNGYDEYAYQQLLKEYKIRHENK